MPVKNKKQLFSVKVQRTGQFVLHALGTRVSLLVVICLALSVAVWLIYLGVWGTLQQQVNDANAILLRVPDFSTSSLDGVIQARDKRVQHKTQPYGVYGGLFFGGVSAPAPVVPSPVVPTPGVPTPTPPVL